MIDGLFLNTLHGDESVGKDLLHVPAVGIELGIVAAGDAVRAYPIYIQACGNGFECFRMEHDHGGEEVVFGTA